MNVFGKVNEKKIKEMLYEMEVHKMRDTGAGSVSFTMYQYLMKGLLAENDKLSQEIELCKEEIKNLKEEKENKKLEEALSESKVSSKKRGY